MSVTTDKEIKYILLEREVDGFKFCLKTLSKMLDELIEDKEINSSHKKQFENTGLYQLIVHLSAAKPLIEEVEDKMSELLIRTMSK
jgi:hypothetical protein